MKKKKYLIIPGNVTSQVDGDIHYVSPKDLMALYKVSPEECEILDKRVISSFHSIDTAYPGLIHLFPRSDGNYKLDK